MKAFAQRPDRERADVFEETAARRGIGRAAIVEKDFWVCWVLSQLFGADGLSDARSATPPLLFKGGTSLSKVFGLINRFSEDIDLTVDRALLISENENPEAPGISGNAQKKRLKILSQNCAAYVRDQALPFLASTGVGTVEIEPDPEQEFLQTLLFTYPKALRAAEYGGTAYVNAVVRLEFGARGDLWPPETGQVTSYAAEEFPGLFSHTSTPVRALSPQRTFWEKATILHAIACSESIGNAERQSRHYADLARIADASVGKLAIANTALLLDVARHKTFWFAKAAARYDLAKPGSLRLVPSEDIQAELAKDNARMREMFISPPPSFSEIMRRIAEIESRVNERVG
jgi:Nucleotidyl transferase AbiEii toxin, Type IV TA system